MSNPIAPNRAHGQAHRRTASRRFYATIAASFGLCLFAGCGPKIPDIIQVGGTVTINDQPLGDARVVCIPMSEGLDGNYTASGITDNEGKFTLTMPGKTEPGCCACECKVLIQEGPLPPGARAEDGSGMPILRAYKKSLKNRPIPKIYQRIGTTPLTITISEENATLDLKLER